MNAKKITFVLSIASLLVIMTAFIFSIDDLTGLKADYNEIWYHYSKVDPTENSHGSKEFWASESNGCKTILLEEPIEGQIIDRDFSINPFFNELTFEDERYIPSIFESRNAVYPIAYGNIDYKYGIYPETVVDDSELINILENLDDSYIDSRNGWYLYEGSYYTYIYTKPLDKNNYVYHNGNKIPNNAKNWFKCEPIIWRELTPNSEDKFLLAQHLLDVIQFDTNSNVYLNSNIREKLNNDFYNKAFALGNSYIKRTLVNDNINPESALKTDFDNVFLPKTQHYTNPQYGFDQDENTKDNKRQASTSDYVRASGAYLYGSGNFGFYFTRTPSSSSGYAKYINEEGQISGLTVTAPQASVRPAITINFNVSK